MKRGQTRRDTSTGVRRWLIPLVLATVLSGSGLAAPSPASADEVPDSGRLEIQKHPKLATALLDDAGLLPSQPGTGNNSATWRDEEGRVKVVLEGPDGGALREAVEANGGEVSSQADTRIAAYVPAAELDDLAASSDVSAIREPTPLIPSVMSEGVVETGAQVWHDEGQTGAGQVVAIVDVGFLGYEAQLGTELPATVQTQNYCDNGLKGGPVIPPPAGPFPGFTHGTTVAEIVHDMAPGASLYLICVDDSVDFELAGAFIDDPSNNIKIVNLSAGNPLSGRGDGSGGDDTFAGVVRKSRLNGRLWVVAAGNDGSSHYHFVPDKKTTTRGSFYYGPGDTAFEIEVAATDVDGDGLNGRAFVSAKWDAWPVTATDVDLYVYPSTNAFITGPAAANARAIADQGGDDAPVEVVNDGAPVNPFPGWANTFGASHTYLLETALPQGNLPPGMRVDYFFSGDITAVQGLTPSEVSEPATSPYALAVGAYDVETGAMEWFSSRGPTIDNRVKPDIAAPDGVTTATGGAFYGTSGATPHVTGAAALVLAENPDLDVVGLQQALEELAADVPPEGPDNVSGAGRLRLGDYGAWSPPEGALLHSLPAPVRVLDTREANCVGEKCTPFEEEEQLDLTIAGTNGVPAEATAVVLNVTVAGTDFGYVTLWPTGEPQPSTSNVNYAAGQVVPNGATVAVGENGSISIFNSTDGTEVLIDLMGYYVESGGAGLQPITPVRAIDTRPSACVGGHCNALWPDETLSALMANTTIGGAAIPDEATALVLNVTVASDSYGFITVYPDGVDRPTTSNLNFTPGTPVANLVVAGIGASNRIQFYNSGGFTHVLVDVVGYFVPDEGSRFVAITPRRALDTRIGTGLRLDPLAPATPFELQIAEINGVPEHAIAVLGNATIGLPSTWGYLSVFPSGVPAPNTSTLNYTAGAVAANSVLTAIGDEGRVRLFSSDGSPEALFDIQGYFIEPPEPA